MEKKTTIDMELLRLKYNRATNQKIGVNEFCKIFGLTQMTYWNYTNGKAPNILGIVKSIVGEIDGLTLDEITIVE